MISGLCGFAATIRREGGEVGAAELIDAARSLALVDLADRDAVRGALRVCLHWAAVHPDAFDQMFDTWFSGRDLVTATGAEIEEPEGPTVELDAETVEAARIHTEDALAIEQDPTDAVGAAAEEGVRRNDAAPAEASPDGTTPVGADGELAVAPPSDEATDIEAGDRDVVVALPDAAPDTELELARAALASTLEARRLVVRSTPRANRITALTEPLSRDERATLLAGVRMIERELQGAPSWRRGRARHGAVDLRRTMRSAVTSGGPPIDIRHHGRRSDAARLVVLVDVSLSVRGTSRLVLHLVHRLRASVGSLRSFGFIDDFVPIDRALRTADPVRAIEEVMGSVDVDASSDPGRAFRAWWSRWQYLVTAATSVVILSDGRCNGREPGYDVIRRVARRSASTVWISPEPEGAWTLGRGEMAEYATCVDRAITVRSVDDLARIAPALRSRRR